ncbi:hypothetical protein ABT270_39450 [Streptomyces sp900105245]|uniref:hypothetical protein n=1 Tax=Streptomyces sp. 900105245 TaxID=3154379 RepID=UPI00331F000D
MPRPRQPFVAMAWLCAHCLFDRRAKPRLADVVLRVFHHAFSDNSTVPLNTAEAQGLSEGTPVRFARPAVLAAALTALLAPATAHAAPAEHATLGAAPGDTVALPVQDALAQLPVRTEDRTGYVRTAFKHWVDADKDGAKLRGERLASTSSCEPARLRRR